MSKPQWLSFAGLVLISAPVVYLWIHEASLFPENEPTTPGLLRVLVAGLTFLAGLGVLLAAAVYAQAGRTPALPRQ